MNVTQKRRGLLGGAGAVVAAATVVILLAARPASSAPTPPPGLEFGVHDTATGAALSLQADPSSDGYGGFTIAAPGLGVVWATATATMSGQSPILQVRYDGDGYLDPDATLDDEFGNGYVLSGDVDHVDLRVVGHVNTTSHEATINFWVGGTHYQLSSGSGGGGGTVSGAAAVARQYVAALLGHDAGAVYDLMDSQTHSAATRDDFIAKTGSDPDFAGVTAAAVSGQPALATTDAGVAYATVGISTTSRGSTTSGTLTLVWEKDAWRVYGVR